MFWYDIAFSLDDVYDFESFIALATKNDIKHGFDAKRYREFISTIQGFKTDTNSWYEAFDLLAEDSHKTINNNNGYNPSNQQIKISRCCGNDPPTQSMLDLLKTGGYAAAKWALSGFKIVSSEEQDDRLKYCDVCEHLYIPTARCNECGCFVRVKAWMATESCPIGKWNALP